MPIVLLTGGTGFIGSHACVEVMAAGWAPVIVDNLSNSSAAVLDRIEAIAGRRPAFVEADVRDRSALDRIFRGHAIDAVIHFAGLKAVGESVADPLRYYDNNVVGTIALIEAMQAHGVTRIVFSSSATVYGTAETMPLHEDSPLGPINPYGRTKLMVEEVLRDVVAGDPGWRAMLLRYFNPVGAHESGLIGEDPTGTPNNLMPFVAQVAIGRRPHVNVYGGDYPTPDGTGVRDYIHVVDLAQGHVAALATIMETGAPRETTVNLGTGRGHSVLEVLSSFEAACGRAIPYEIVARRPGDAATCYADATRARILLGWTAGRGLHAMCADAWRWQSTHPKGFRT
ncbi:MAG: UDP-glucose 4-epimerase GalE [Betaproteobacteria bacterium]